jgi:TonB-dependent SusC/RagA subfamily outer membrane receptor
MRFLFLIPFIFLYHINIAQLPVQAPARLLDSKMKLKTASINITTDAITATTFMELEFLNPNNVEIEGLLRFQLAQEQIVTAFQLDLHGKYRDGSIEEKWKATNAYNRIVGKRIDPALLTKEYDNNYNLRIYPIAAKQSRKVTITIQQLLKSKKQQLYYTLPFIISDTASLVSIIINTNAINAKPRFNSGLLHNEKFSKQNGIYQYAASFPNKALNAPLQFELAHTVNPFICTKQSGGNNYFAIRYQPKVDSFYQIHPKHITVFWDISGTGGYRNTEKEISFLKQYISTHKTEQVTLITFNHTTVDTLQLIMASGGIWKLTEHLRTINYEGGTRFARLNFSTVKSDAVFIFSDGKSSIGSKQPVSGRLPVFTISTSAVVDSFFLKRMSFGSGGTYIPLHKLSITSAIDQASKAETYLMDLLSSGKSIFESSLNLKLNDPILIYGTSKSVKDTITLVYGNSGTVASREQLILDNSNSCNGSAIDRLNMLESYNTVITNYNWNDVLDFGLREKIVTPYTAYIVLERIEDYIQYNITPPKELEEECMKHGYVKKDTRQQRMQLQKKSPNEQLRQIVNMYNKRIQLWDKNEQLLTYEPLKQQVTENFTTTTSSTNNPLNILEGKAAGVMIQNTSRGLDEVVVVGYGTVRKKTLTGAVAVVSAKEIQYGFVNVSQILACRVPGLSVSGSTGEPGSSATIWIRGASSLSASAQPLFVVDGVPVNGHVDQIINPNDIESITVLRDAAGTAIYGSGAANGVIIITTKKGRNYSGYQWHRYKLANQPDVDYLQEIKKTSVKDKLVKYYKLKDQYKNDAGFYLDMADHLFDNGFHSEAVQILMNVSELFQNNAEVIRTIGFILQQKQEYVLAAELFEILFEENPWKFSYCRDLAWAYYQNKEYQKAIDAFYKGVLFDGGSQYAEDTYLHERSLLLTEMNAIIHLHRDSLNLSQIPLSLIKALPVDLRIVAEDNSGYAVNLRIDEPGNSIADVYRNNSKHGGYFITADRYNYYHAFAEYQLKDAVKGKYKIWATFYNGKMYKDKVPSVIRLLIFKNFGKPNQSIEIQNIMMDNQYGEIEIAEISW